MLYTDGVTEARTSDGMFGTERLEELVRRAPDCAPTAIAERVERTVMAAAERRGARRHRDPRARAAAVDGARMLSRAAHQGYGRSTMAESDPTAVTTTAQRGDAAPTCCSELVAHLRENRTQLREEWARRITEARLLTAMTQEEIFSEATSVYDNYVEVLETGSVEALQALRAQPVRAHHPARASRRTRSSASCCCCATCWPGRCSQKYQADFDLLNRVLDAYEPAANRIANTVARRASCRSASASSASSRRRSASCPRRCCRCASGC